MSMLEVLCKRMPLSSMVRGLFERCFSADRLNGLFAREAKEQYTRNILFSTLCEVMLQVVLRVHPSAHAAYQAQEAEMDFSKASLYDKLKGIENQVCVALLRACYELMEQNHLCIAVTMHKVLPSQAVE
jgi:hypothetical protein